MEFYSDYYSFFSDFIFLGNYSLEFQSENVELFDAVILFYKYVNAILKTCHFIYSTY